MNKHYKEGFKELDKKINRSKYFLNKKVLNVYLRSTKINKRTKNTLCSSLCKQTYHH